MMAHAPTYYNSRMMCNCILPLLLLLFLLSLFLLIFIILARIISKFISFLIRAGRRKGVVDSEESCY
jgi:phosphotransferase system  glucose/maltose/N-acetylglucosamine-specific IIC component